MSWSAVRACWGWYQQQLSRCPLRTQVATSAVLWGSGDVIAQQIDRHMAERQMGERHVAQRQMGEVARQQEAGDRPVGAGDMGAEWRQTAGAAVAGRGEGCTADVSTCRAGGLPSGAEAVPECASQSVNEHQGVYGHHSLDYRRLLTTGLFGAGFVGPAGHYWYGGLETYVKDRLRLRPSSMRFVAAKLFLDTFAFGPVHLAAFFTYTGAVSGHSLEQIQRDLARDFVPGFLTEATVWPVIQTVNFKVVPVQHQLLFVNFFCLLDSAWLSWLKYQQDALWKSWLTKTVFGGSDSSP